MYLANRIIVKSIASYSFFAVLAPLSAKAVETITEITPLSFGQFVIADNAATSTITIRTDGRNPVYSNRAYPIAHGSYGEYLVTGYPANLTLTVSIISTHDLSTASATTEDFTVGSFTTTTARTDENGEATFYVGATLSTTGSGTGYVDADYDATYTINVTY